MNLKTEETNSLNRRGWIPRVSSHPLFYPVFLLLLCILAYGVLIPWLSFYADDWILLWIYQHLGAWGVDYYHVTNRPFLAPLYQILLPLLGAEPWRWQIFAVLAPWVASLTSWWLVKGLWPNRARFAFFVGILVAIYPGYLSHGVALTTGHRYIILSIYLLSLILTVLAIRKPKYFWLFYALSLLASIYNMLAMEYFLFLELARPFVIWIVLSESALSVKQKLKKTALLFAPFFLCFIAVLYWRVFLFPYQTFNHSLTFFDDLQKSPIPAIAGLIKQMLEFIWLSTVQAWIQPLTSLFHPPQSSAIIVAYYGLILLTSAVTYFGLWCFHKNGEAGASDNQRLGKDLLLLSIVPWLMGGIPFILVELQPGLGGYETRYLLPYLLVSCLWIAYIIIALIKKFSHQIIVLSVLVGLSAGLQLLSTNNLRTIGERRQNFFWNLSYRIPDLEPGTLIITNELPTGDGATAWSYLLNWLYQPDLKTNYFPYMMVIGSQMNSFLDRQTDEVDIIGGHFQADWSKVAFLYYDGKGCLKILNPEFKEEIPSLDARTQKWLDYASLDPILPSSKNPPVDPSKVFLRKEPIHTWCYFYEKADLARQEGNWEAVREYGDEAIYQKALSFLSDTELYPFIQAYALGGEWEKALQLLKQAVDYRIGQDGIPNQALLQSTWDFIDQNTPHSEGKTLFKQYVLGLNISP